MTQQELNKEMLCRALGDLKISEKTKGFLNNLADELSKDRAVELAMLLTSAINAAQIEGVTAFYRRMKEDHSCK